MEMVLRSDREKPLPHRRYMVADGDWRDFDHTAARGNTRQTRLGYVALTGCDRQCGEHAGAAGGSGRDRLSDNSEAVAVDDANDLWGRRALSTGLLAKDSR